MENAANDLTQLKSRMKTTWMAGDFGQIANFTSREAEKFVERIGLPRAARVLDVGPATRPSRQRIWVPMLPVSTLRQIFWNKPESARRSSTWTSVSRKAMPKISLFRTPPSTWC